MEGPDETGGLKRLNWTTGPTTSRGRYYEGQGTVVPTAAGLCPALVPEELYVPSFAKATKGFSLSSALVTEELYVQTGAEPETLAFTDFNKPRRAGGESFTVDAFGHEKNPARENRWKVGKEILNFDQIVFG